MLSLLSVETVHLIVPFIQFPSFIPSITMTTTKEQVAAMAYSTGERLKSSAVELFRGLESSLQNREQFEVALAKMFGSCTGDFKAQPQGPLQSRSGSSLSYGEEHDDVPPRQTLGASPFRREASNSPSRRGMTKSSPKSSASSRKKRGTSSIGSSGRSSSHTPAGATPRERRQSRADYGEHIYAQLFMDDQKRAAAAVSTIHPIGAIL